MEAFSRPGSLVHPTTGCRPEGQCHSRHVVRKLQAKAHSGEQVFGEKPTHRNPERNTHIRQPARWRTDTKRESCHCADLEFPELLLAVAFCYSLQSFSGHTQRNPVVYCFHFCSNSADTRPRHHPRATAKVPGSHPDRCGIAGNSRRFVASVLALFAHHGRVMNRKR